jgi:hypothetical protein
MRKKSSLVVNSSLKMSEVAPKLQKTGTKPPKTQSGLVEVKQRDIRSDAELKKVIQQAHAELASRGSKDAFSQTSAVLSWVQLILNEMNRTTTAAYWLASRPKGQAALIRRACGFADEFVRSLGCWTIDEFTRLQRCVIVAVIEHLRTCEQNVMDIELIALSLRDASVAFSAQFPQYVELGLVPFLVSRGDD